MWTKGGLPGKVHDKALADFYNVHSEIDNDEWILADSGYQGSIRFITPFKGRNLTVKEKLINRMIGRHRVLVENVLGQIKVFNCLKNPWRNKICLHKVCWIVICNITNIKLKLYPIQ